MTKKIDENIVKPQPICPRLRAMEIGDIIKFPVFRLNAVRASCSQFGLQWGKTFQTTVRRNENAIEVTRTS